MIIQMKAYRRKVQANSKDGFEVAECTALDFIICIKHVKFISTNNVYK